VKVNVKLLKQSLEENEKMLEKVKANNAALDIGNVKKEESVKLLNEKVTVLESEKSFNQDEIQRLMKIKAELIIESNFYIYKKNIYLFLNEKD
jgi:hypothetical protein